MTPARLNWTRERSYQHHFGAFCGPAIGPLSSSTKGGALAPLSAYPCPAIGAMDDCGAGDLQANGTPSVTVSEPLHEVAA